MGLASIFSDIADAVRHWGFSGTLRPDDMPAAILSIKDVTYPGLEEREVEASVASDVVVTPSDGKLIGKIKITPPERVEMTVTAGTSEKTVTAPGGKAISKLVVRPTESVATTVTCSPEPGGTIFVEPPADKLFSSITVTAPPGLVRPEGSVTISKMSATDVTSKATASIGVFAENTVKAGVTILGITGTFAANDRMPSSSVVVGTSFSGVGADGTSPDYYKLAYVKGSSLRSFVRDTYKYHDGDVLDDVVWYVYAGYVNADPDTPICSGGPVHSIGGPVNVLWV